MNSITSYFVSCFLILSILVSSGCLHNDSDGDGVENNIDVFPNDPGEWKDSDGDGVGDNGDAFPNDPSESADSDGDGVGDNGDAFPNDPGEWKDSDGDGVGDNGDAFPNDPSEWADPDGDGVGDNSDAFPNDPSEWTDSDGDGVGDNGDVFPDDANETVDSDGDGVGDNGDAFPDDPSEWADSDGDGVGDNSDAFPNDPSEWEDPDGDGLGSNYEQQIGTDPNDADSDDDGLSDGVETNTEIWVSSNDTGTDPLNADSDNDEVGDGAETNTGNWLSNENTGTDPLDNDTDDDGLSDGQESNSGQPVWILDEEWTAPNDVNEPYEPEDIFVETDLKVNVVFIGAEVDDDEKENIANKVYQEYIPLDHVMESMMLGSDYEPIGVEYSLDLSIINAPDELFSDYSAYLNGSASRNWTVGSYIDGTGNDYVDDAFDELWGDDDYSDGLISGINVRDAESWLYWNVPTYEGMEDIYDGYTLYFLIPEAWDVWPYYYYSETDDIDTGQEAVANNLVAYGGNYPLYFIDLTTPPPSFGQGFGCDDDCANRENNPPVWLWDDMSDDEIDTLLAEYIEESVQFLFAPSYVYTPEYEYEYELDVILIDATSDSSVTATDYFNMATTQTALDMIVPYTEWTFEILSVDIDDEFLEDYKAVLDDTTETISCNLGGDAQIIDSNALIPKADELIIRPDGIVTIPVFVTIFDDCGWVDSIGIMGSASPYNDGTPFGVFMATGKKQLENDGLTSTVVHEIGHMLGLMHPHQSFGYDTGELDWEQDWFWDQSATAMSYYEELENNYLDRLNRDTLDRGHALILLDGVQNYRYEIWTEVEDKGYDYDTVPNDLFQTILEMDEYWNLSIEEFEQRNYFSYYSSGLDAVNLALHSLEIAVDALEMAEALDNYIPKIWVDLGTDPNNPDTDGDGLLDGLETMTGIMMWDQNGPLAGTNPLLYDTDGDGLSDGDEIFDTDTDPTDGDTDNDGLLDGVETNTGVWVDSSDTGTDPNDADTDGDLLLDGVETKTGIFVSDENTGTDPLNYDTDGDGLEDGFEVIDWGSDPNMVDTDGDGYDDGDDYWPTFDLQIYIEIKYYNVENTDIWTEDDVYFYVNIENTGWELTDVVYDQDENYVSYNYSYNAADNQPYFFFWVEAWDDDVDDNDQYDIDGRNIDDNQLFLVYYPRSGWVDGDAPHIYIIESDDGGWTWVIVDGSDDGDGNYHDAEIWIIVGWIAG